MKYLYNENPLATKIILDKHDKKILRLKLEIEDLEDHMYSAQVHLKDGEHYNLMIAHWNINYPKLYTPEREKELDDRANGFIEGLTTSHDGSCCCISGSCLKCHATELLGIDELGYSSGHFNKYVGHFIFVAFENVKTCFEAIQYLKDNPPTDKSCQIFHDNYQKAIDYLENHNKLLNSYKGIK